MHGNLGDRLLPDARQHVVAHCLMPSTLLIPPPSLPLGSNEQIDDFGEGMAARCGNRLALFKRIDAIGQEAPVRVSALAGVFHAEQRPAAQPHVATPVAKPVAQYP